MDRFLGQSSLQRAEQFERAANALGLTPSAVEKDLWVCWVLRALFASAFGGSLTFKGGTSLSKCWELIERFSEDIDLVVDRGFLGFEGAAAPEVGESKRERERRVEAVVAACQEHVAKGLLPALQAAAGKLLRSGQVDRIDLDPADVDRQTILFEYATLFDRDGYIRPVVKVELGARSDTEPSRSPVIKAYAAEGSALDGVD